MTSFTNLSLPRVTTGSEAGGWDEAFGEEEWNRTAWARPSISPHAVAHGCHVFGTNSADCNDWITWTASFVPHQVCRVASNRDGTIVAVSTDGGTVSLLRARDGKVLATRKVSSVEGIQAPAEISFVGGTCIKDVLAIQVPPPDDEDMLKQEEKTQDTNVILVSSIDGERLNNENPATIAEAVRSMSITKMNLDFKASNQVSSLMGCFTNANTIRFMAADTDGNLSIHDYNTVEKQSKFVQPVFDTEESDQTFVSYTGIRLQQFGNDDYFFVLSLRSSTSAKVCWYHVTHLSLSCEYDLSNKTEGDVFIKSRPKLFAIEPVRSCDDDSAMAVAVALKSSKEASIHIFQAVADVTMGLVIVSSPHLVYVIPITSEMETASVQSIGLASLNRRSSGPYSFRCKVWFGSEDDTPVCKEFTSRNSSGHFAIAGEFRLLLAKDLCDAADKLIASPASRQLIESDPFAQVHSSEVAVRRLQQLLQKGSVSNMENMENARECLHRLAGGAVSGNEIGFHCLLNAVNNVSSWPANDVIQKKPSLFELRMALNAMSSTIIGITKKVPPSKSSVLEKQKEKLDKQLTAMKCMERILGAQQDTPMSAPFLGVQSVGDFFCALVSEGFFPVAERLKKSVWGHELSPEVMASAILSIPPSFDPRGYASLLTDEVIPALSVSHEALPLIRRWACHTAEAFDADDTNELGLDSSIFLLQTVLDANKELNVKIHSSFSSFSPFVERKIWSNVSPTSRKSPSFSSNKSSARSSRDGRSNVSPSSASIASSSRNFSFSSKGLSQASRRRHLRGLMTSTTGDERPFPTLLELGMMKGGPQKNRVKSPASYGSQGMFSDPFEDGDDCVEIRLQQAKLLKEARSLGLAKQHLNLRNYSRLGGAYHAAMELVRKFSSSAADHDDRFSALTSRVRPYCERAGVSYDNALVEYASQNCKAKTTIEEAIVESASVARCCSSSTSKCQIALSVFEAALLLEKTSPCLAELSKDAIVWASGASSIRSELEEATRVLVIDGIVLRYCGSGARKVFDNANPLHAAKLLDFVCRHIDHPSVLSDALDLCDAFTTLSKVQAGFLILQRTILVGKVDRCSEVLDQICKEDEKLAKEACSKTLSFCVETISECTEAMKALKSGAIYDKKRTEAVIAAEATLCILSTIQANFSDFFSESVGCISLREKHTSSWGSLHQEFQRISELQKSHNLFLSLSDLRSETNAFDVAKQLMHPVIESYKDGSNDKLRSSLGNARRGCSLLFGSDELEISRFWCGVVRDASCRLACMFDNGSCVDLLGASGILDEIGTDASFQAVLSVALSLCFKTSKGAVSGVERRHVLSLMKHVIRASSLISDYALINCPNKTLPVAVSIGSITDIAGQILTRGDEGTGEVLDSFRMKLNEEARVRREPLGINVVGSAGQRRSVLVSGRPILHPSWYVGDGLLLPPSEALSRCIVYFRELMSSIRIQTEATTPSFNGAFSLHNFLATKGAHSIGLRLLCFSAATRLSSAVPHLLTADNSTDGQSHAANQETIRCLLERSLGGSGNGLTSGTIDSQLAVSFLLSLPIKVAFKVYKASLPTAIARRDFVRVITLSNIGVHAGNEASKVGWNNQTSFVKQCRGLSSNARWWKVLQRYKVDFDPRRFEDMASSGPRGDATRRKDLAGNAPHYVASLVPSLIRNSSRFLSGSDVRCLVTKFVTSFGLDHHLAAQRHVQYLLSCPPDKIAGTDTAFSRNSGFHDIRYTLTLCERAARDSLRLLPTPIARSAVIRRCVNEIEKSADHGVDYERHSMLLSLYHEELSIAVAQAESMRHTELIVLREELEVVDCRRDALEILSSFFQGRRKAERPSFPKFFTPIPVPFKPAKGRPSKRIRYRILREAQDQACDFFDPLDPLMPYLSENPDTKTAKALAPLSGAIGIPEGFIHSRALVERFRLAAAKKIALPSFDGDIAPVIHRIQNPQDTTELLEWCADMYAATDNIDDKLKCLDHALQYAKKATVEAEHRLQSCSDGDEKALAAEEKQAHDIVKRIREKKSVLSDHHLLDQILHSGADHLPSVLNELSEKVASLFNKEPYPEFLIETILSEASLGVSTAALDDEVAPTTIHIRSVANLIHQACKTLSDQHSHVHAGAIARRLAKKWLLHGDGVTEEENEETSQTTSTAAVNLKPDLSLLTLEEEDDTINFIMNLNDLGEDDQVWSDDVGSGGNLKNDASRKTTSEEEPSGLKTDGSSREVSEFESRRVAIRIAFVLSFAESTVPSVVENEDVANEENAGSSSNSRPTQEKKSRPTLLSRISTTSTSPQSVSVMEHTRELLRIVFAKSGGTQLVSDLSQSFFTTNGSTESTENRRTITFSMRHRALRTAATLCPQEALDRVVREECYMMNSEGEPECTLRQCAFGSFVAKEIEEMGLPLPHSDLVALSTMHFPSYARALWRHHRSVDCNGYKGRLLLLLLEMSMKENKVTDRALVNDILNEMSEMKLPRGLLLGCESILNFKKRAMESEYSYFLEECNEALSRALTKVAKSILKELHQKVTSEATSVSDYNVLPTIRRLGHVVMSLGDVKKHLTHFVHVLLDLLMETETRKVDVLVAGVSKDGPAEGMVDRKITGGTGLSEGLARIALDGICCLQEGETRESLLANLARSKAGNISIGRRVSAIRRRDSNESKRSDDEAETLSELALQQALSFDTAVANVFGENEKSALHWPTT